MDKLNIFCNYDLTAKTYYYNQTIYIHIIFIPRDFIFRLGSDKMEQGFLPFTEITNMAYFEYKDQHIEDSLWHKTVTHTGMAVNRRPYKSKEGQKEKLIKVIKN
jgi:hypothetical protein